MKSEIFIVSNGKLFCDSKTIGFTDGLNKVNYPVKNISDIYCFGSISLTSGIIKRVLMNELNVHFLSKYGTYRGSLSYCSLLNGKVIRNQVIFSLNLEIRLKVAVEILYSLRDAMKNLLMHYAKKGYELKDEIGKIKNFSFEGINSIENLMGSEAEMWRSFYNGVRKIIQNFDFLKREYHPPKGEINALISFGNMILYSQVFSIIKEVGLLPEIGFLHESNERRYSLAIDIAEMFKPYIVMATVIYLVNKKIISKENFRVQSAYTFLDEDGKFFFIKEFNRRINKKIYLKELKRDVSMRFLIKRECQKLKNFLEFGNRYKSFKRWYVCL